MERKIGEIFTYKGKTYQVVKGNTCEGCAFMKNGHCFSISKLLGLCSYTNRTDKTGVIFKEINNMEIKNNQLTIDIPEGMEIDLENSDLTKGIVRFKQSIITYKDVEDTLKLGINCKSIMVNKNNVSKLVTLSKLMNIAKYYNGDWKPNWRSLMESKYYIYYSTRSNTYGVANTSNTNYGNIYFRLYEDAKAVIENPNFRDILDAIYKN